MDTDPRSYRVPVLRLSDMHSGEEDQVDNNQDVVTPWDTPVQQQNSQPQQPQQGTGAQTAQAQQTATQQAPVAPAPTLAIPALPVTKNTDQAKPVTTPAVSEPPPVHKETAARIQSSAPSTAANHDAPTAVQPQPRRFMTKPTVHPPTPEASTNTEPTSTSTDALETSSPQQQTEEPRSFGLKPLFEPSKNAASSEVLGPSSDLPDMWEVGGIAPEETSHAKQPLPVAEKLRGPEAMRHIKSALRDTGESEFVAPTEKVPSAVPGDTDVAPDLTPPPTTPAPTKPPPQTPSPENDLSVASTTDTPVSPHPSTKPAPTVEVPPMTRDSIGAVPIDPALQKQEATRSETPDPQVQSAERLTSSGMLTKMLNAFGVQDDTPDGGTQQVSKNRADISKPREEVVPNTGRGQPGTVSEEGVRPTQGAVEPADAPVSVTNDITKDTDVGPSSSLKTSFPPVPTNNTPTAPSRTFGNDTFDQKLRAPLHAPTGTVDGVRAKGDAASSNMPRSVAPSSPGATDTFVQPSEDTHTQHDQLPTQVVSDEGDDPLDLRGPTAMPSAPESTVPQSHTATPGTDNTRETVGDSSLQAFVPIPDTNIEKEHPAVPKRKPVTPNTGTSLASLRDRVLQTSIETPSTEEMSQQKAAPAAKELSRKDVETLKEVHGLMNNNATHETFSLPTAGPEPTTEHARAIAGVADELEDIAAPEEPTVSQDQNPKLPKVYTSLPMLRTYRGDVERAVTKGKVSMVNMISAEEKRRSAPEPKVAQRKVVTSQRGIRNRIIASTVLAVAAVGLIAFSWYLLRSEPQPYVGDNTLMATEQGVQHEVTGVEGTALRSDLRRLADGLEERRNSIVEIQLVKKSLAELGVETTSVVTSEELFAVLGTSAPTSLSRNVDDTYMLGVHQLDNAEVFLILKTSSYDNALAGMFEWEATLLEDLEPLFGRADEYVPIKEYDPDAEPTPQLVAATASSTATSTDTLAVTAARAPDDGEGIVFRDVSVANMASRGIHDKNGDYLLLWTMPDRSTVVITTHAETLREIRARTD